MIGSARGPGGRFLRLRRVDTSRDASKRPATNMGNQKDREFIMGNSKMCYSIICPQRMMSIIRGCIVVFVECQSIFTLSKSLSLISLFLGSICK